MKQNFKKSILLLLLITAIISCDTNDQDINNPDTNDQDMNDQNPNDPDPNDPNTNYLGLQSNVDVYMVGATLNSNGKLKATIWKNGIATYLTNGATDAELLSIAVANNDVYVAGYEKASNGIHMAKYWKNGVATTLTSGITFASCNDIFISDNDVYIAGREVTNNKVTAVYWKNNTPNYWDVSGAQNAFNSIFVNGTDIYAFGTLQHAMFNGPFSYAIQYKNANSNITSTTLGANGQLTHSSANQGIIVDSDVYVVGYQQVAQNGSTNIIKLWKNGIETSITNGSTFADASSLFVQGTDVYVGGFESNTNLIEIAKYWKNGNAHTLTDGTLNSRVTAMKVYNNNVYSAVEVKINSTTNEVNIWKNTTLVSALAGATHISDMLIIEN